MRKKIVIFIIGLLLFSDLTAQTQIDARNGFRFPTSGIFRVFVVFAEAVGDPNYNTTITGWNAGQLPDNPNSYINTQLGVNFQSYISRYFNEISFGTLNVIGDYYPQLLQIPYTSANYSGVFNELDALCNGNQLITSNYLNFPNDFDLWNLGTSSSLVEGRIKQNTADGKIDCIVIFWRINSHYPRTGGELYPFGQWGGGGISNKGISTYGYIYTDDNTVLEHEFAHGLVGPNEFHCAPTNGGIGMFIEDYSGYSILSGNGKNMDAYNGWDRCRLGWKNPQQQYTISARDMGGQERNGDLIYGENIGDSAIFILRDFASTNDAVRIKLPYIRTLNTQTREQWLWIENHQLIPSNIEYDPYKHGTNSPMYKIPKGIRFNIQIGNEDFTQFYSSRTNYISPLSRFGKYDFTYQYGTQLGDGTIGYLAVTDSTHSNPFFGMGFNTHPVDINSDNVLQTREYVLPGKIQYNGAILGTENFGYHNYPVFGSVYDAFYPGDNISISTNPTNTPWLTYLRKSGKLLSPYPNPATDDNRYIYLNGLCIRVLEQSTNGDMKISIRWNDFDIKNNVRWCGDIILNENIIVKPNCSVLLDQGLSPTRPVNPIVFNGQSIFTDPTRFTAKEGSLFKVEISGVICLKNNTSYIAESGSILELNDKSIFTVDAGSTLQIRSGANVNISGGGKIVVKSGGYLCVESGANINLQDYNSLIEMEEGATYVANPTLFSSPVCLESIPTTGNGTVADYNEDVYIQNETISTDRFIAGRNIYIGYDVTTAKPYGNVLINGSSTVICKAAHDVIIKNGYDCEIGSSFEIQK